MQEVSSLASTLTLRNMMQDLVASHVFRSVEVLDSDDSVIYPYEYFLTKYARSCGLSLKDAYEAAHLIAQEFLQSRKQPALSISSRYQCMWLTYDKDILRSLKRKLKDLTKSIRRRRAKAIRMRLKALQEALAPTLKRNKYITYKARGCIGDTDMLCRKAQTGRTTTDEEHSQSIFVMFSRYSTVKMDNAFVALTR